MTVCRCTGCWICTGQVEGCTCHIDYGRINPGSPDYCPECNYDRHLCPGCGIWVGHGEVACPKCKLP